MIKGYDNEEFLYINNAHLHFNEQKGNEEHEEVKEDRIPFIKGRICDPNGIMVCLGEIVPRTASRFDEDFAEYITNLKYWMPLIRGIRIRIFWYADANDFIVSSSGKIFPNESILFISEKNIKQQIKFEFLDKSMCYYAIIEHETKNIILTYIVKNHSETVEMKFSHISAVVEDRAFRWHIEMKECLGEEEITRIATKEKDIQRYGIVFIRNNGEMIEFTNQLYQKIRMLEKPDYLNYNEYYSYALNKNPADNQINFEHYFEKELHVDINNELLVYFPEYKLYFDDCKEKLQAYINKTFADADDDEEQHVDQSRNDMVLSERDDDDYNDVCYEITKNSIHPLYNSKNNINNNKCSTETKEGKNNLEDSIDQKKIKFTRKLVENNNMDDIVRILTLIKV